MRHQHVKFRCSAERYLSPDVLIARGADKRKTNQEYISLGVRKRTESVVIFLACRVPQTERNGLPIDHNICGIVIEHCASLSERPRGSTQSDNTPVGMYSPYQWICMKEVG